MGEKRYLLKMALTAATFSILMQGCHTPYTQSPVAVNFKKTEQHKLQAAAHWQVIAKDLARSIRCDSPVYIELPQGASAFDRSFHAMLTTELVKRGIEVVKNRQNAVNVIRYDTQLIYFTRPKRWERAGVLAALGAGVYLLRNANPGQIAGATVAAFEAANIYNSKFTSTPHGEFIINLRVDEGDKIRDSHTKIYYIVDTDGELYVPQTANIIELES